MSVQIPDPVSGGLMLSYKCLSECRHCMYACSPEWDGDWISEQDLELLLSILAPRIIPAPYGSHTMSLNHGLHFTGGEPFLNFPLLVKAVETAKRLKIPSLFVETNCFFCTDKKKTEEKFALLKEKGLSGILISVNPFYLEYVPFERTETGIQAGLKVFGKNTMVYQYEYYRQFKSLGFKKQVPLHEYMEKIGKENMFSRVEFFLSGRAPYRLKNDINNLFPLYPADVFYSIPCRPSFLREWHNHFDNYGNYMPGYCGGISFGNWQDMDILVREGIDEDEKPVLAFLCRGDFRGLFGFAKDHGYEEPGEGYFSKCHFCVDIRRFLVKKGDFKELRPVEFYSKITGSSF